MMSPHHPYLYYYHKRRCLQYHPAISPHRPSRHMEKCNRLTVQNIIHQFWRHTGQDCSADRWERDLLLYLMQGQEAARWFRRYYRRGLRRGLRCSRRPRGR